MVVQPRSNFTLPVLSCDVITVICSWVQHEAMLVVLIAVCREWKNVADQNSQWYRLLETRLPAALSVAVCLDLAPMLEGAKDVFLNHRRGQHRVAHPHVSSMEEFLFRFEVSFRGNFGVSWNNKWPVNRLSPVDESTTTGPFFTPLSIHCGLNRKVDGKVKTAEVVFTPTQDIHVFHLNPLRDFVTEVFKLGLEEEYFLRATVFGSGWVELNCVRVEDGGGEFIQTVLPRECQETKRKIALLCDKILPY